MAVFLRDIYEAIKKEEEIELVAGEKGIDNEIRWVHMVEGTDISSFLEGDELAFTTGIALNGPDELMDLVRYNYRQKAAGMVINIGPYITEIPDEIIRFGNENAFPIFRVPWRVHMANIMRYCSMQISLDTQKELEFSSALKNAVYFPENEELYIPALLKYGFKKEWSYCIAAAEIYNKKYSMLKETEKNTILRFAQNYFREYGSKVFVLEIDENIVFFFANCNEKKINEELNDMWKEIEARILPGGNAYAGIGRSTGSIRYIGKCFEQAVQVKKLQKKKNRKNVFISYNDLGLYKLLLSMENSDIVNEYYNETLGFLEHYDRVNETDYMYFLKTYFDLGCSVQNLAAQMHMHRNSVTYKMHKIEEIMNISINDPEERTKLMIAFMIKEIM